MRVLGTMSVAGISFEKCDGLQMPPSSATASKDSRQDKAMLVPKPVQSIRCAVQNLNKKTSHHGSFDAADVEVLSAKRALDPDLPPTDNHKALLERLCRARCAESYSSQLLVQEST